MIVGMILLKCTKKKVKWELMKYVLNVEVVISALKERIKMDCPNCKENPFFDEEEQCHTCGYMECPNCNDDGCEHCSPYHGSGNSGDKI